MTTQAGRSSWVLTLYVNGASPNSMQAIEAVRRVCDEELTEDVELEIIDVQEEPALVVRDGVVAAPTLVRRLPSPLRRIVGHLADSGRLHLALGLRTRDTGSRPGAAGR